MNALGIVTFIIVGIVIGWFIWGDGSKKFKASTAGFLRTSNPNSGSPGAPPSAPTSSAPPASKPDEESFF